MLLNEVRPLLRGLFPSVTHYTLARFSVDPAAGEIRIEVTGDGTCRLDSSWSDY